MGKRSNTMRFGALALVVGGWIALRHRHRPPANAFYVALGSSFAAGLGLGRRAPGSPLVSQRSSNGYPGQLARLLDVPSFTDMTSSGSTVRHVLHGGQFGLPPQIDALGPETRLVTLTAGGNDIGYVGDLMRLAYRNRGGALGTLIGTLWRGAKPAVDRDFPSLKADLTATLHEIRRRSPRAMIIVATYPTILPSSGTCRRLGLTAEQAALMRSVGDWLAETTRSAARATGAVLVDMAALSAGHDACGAEAWVNGFQASEGAAFHPCLAGAQATALAIAASCETKHLVVPSPI